MRDDEYKVFMVMHHECHDLHEDIVYSRGVALTNRGRAFTTDLLARLLERLEDSELQGYTAYPVERTWDVDDCPYPYITKAPLGEA